MKDINIKFMDKLDENQLAQEIDNNPEPVIEIIPHTPTTIEDMIDPIPELNDETIADISPTPETVIEDRIAKAIPKNTVRYIDGGFTF